MLQHCPYCQSFEVHRMFVSHSKQHPLSLHRESSLASQLGLGGMVIKKLVKGWHLSPWMMGLAEVLIKGVYLYWIETQQSHFDSNRSIEFYCEQCHRAFSS